MHNYKQHIDPQREQFEAFKALPRDKPIMMLNLIRLRDSAAYEDGTEATGAKAYAIYSKNNAPVFQSVGGEIIWRGKPQTILIGPEDEHWDLAFIARYPTAGAFLAMLVNPDYQAIVHHRRAAVLESRLLPLSEVDPN